MSVNYSSSIYYGYKITKEQIKALSEEAYEELINHEYYHRFDCYSENENTIFGFRLYHTESLIEINNISIITQLKEKLIEAYYDIFKKYPTVSAYSYLCLNVT